MSNMSYCRFRNTLSDLADCKESLDFDGLDGEGEDEKMDEKERAAAISLIELCREIADEHGHFVDEQESDQ